jgi:hypothetical protein
MDFFALMMGGLTATILIAHLGEALQKWLDGVPERSAAAQYLGDHQRVYGPKKWDLPSGHREAPGRAQAKRDP